VGLAQRGEALEGGADESRQPTRIRGKATMRGDIRPQKKATVIVQQLEDKVYFRKPGYAAEVPDPTGSIRFLLDLMDGSRTVAQLCDLVRAKYPSVTNEALAQALTQFDRSGFLEDGGAGPDGLLDDYELVRWNRNLSYLEAFASTRVSKYELQHRIKSAKVALLGLGGVGSHLLYDLAAMGVQDIRAVEFDRVELWNLNRQILYTEADIGRLKSEAAAERVQAFSPRLKLDIVPRRICSTDDVLEVIHDRDFVLCVADQPRTEIVHWVNEACVRRGVALVVGGHDMERVVYYTIIPGVTGCVECWIRQVRQRDPLSAALIEERRRAQTFLDNGTFAPPISVVSGLMLCELTRLVTGIEPPVATGKLMEVRFKGSAMREAETWDRFADCRICHAAVPSAAHAGYGSQS
jgi:molybdopterin/thiamine biosynthesis adenylyltransferase